jgi:uncharacterized protein
MKTMNDLAPPKGRFATWCGLAIALFSGPLLVAGFRAITGENHSNLQLISRELCIFFMVGLLFWIITSQEKLPLASIGLHTNKLLKSILRGLMLTMIMLMVTVGLYFLLKKFGIHLGSKGSDSFQPSPWVVTLMMLRAGVAEEIFYRGYAIERLRGITGNTWLAALVPLAIFAAAHYRQGPGGIIAACVLGGVFTVSYLKFRDLIANITAHFLGDFTLNVVLPLVTGG